MIGTYAVGNQSYQIDLTPSTQFKVQTKRSWILLSTNDIFANHANDMVKQRFLKISYNSNLYCW